jgi:hypothetical protein
VRLVFRRRATGHHLQVGAGLGNVAWWRQVRKSPAPPMYYRCTSDRKSGKHSISLEFLMVGTPSCKAFPFTIPQSVPSVVSRRPLMLLLGVPQMLPQPFRAGRFLCHPFVRWKACGAVVRGELDQPVARRHGRIRVREVSYSTTVRFSDSVQLLHCFASLCLVLDGGATRGTPRFASVRRGSHQSANLSFNPKANQDITLIHLQEKLLGR